MEQTRLSVSSHVSRNRGARVKSELKSIQRQYDSTNINLQDVFFFTEVSSDEEGENITVNHNHELNNDQSIVDVPYLTISGCGKGKGKGSRKSSILSGRKQTVPHFPILPQSLTFSQLVFLIEQTIIKYVNLPHDLDQFFIVGGGGSEKSSVLEGNSSIGFRDDVNVKSSIYRFVIKPLLISLTNPVMDIFEGDTVANSDLKSYQFQQQQHSGILTALITLQFYFSNMAHNNISEDADEERAIYEARAYAAESISIKYLNALSEDQKIVSSTFDCQYDKLEFETLQKVIKGEVIEENELAQLSVLIVLDYQSQIDIFNTLKSLDKLCTLEIAVLNKCTRFLCAPSVRRLIQDLWSGRIVMWDKIISDAVREPKIVHDSTEIGWFAKLRIPRYRTFLVTLNYFILLVLYYITLDSSKAHLHKNIDIVEVFMHIWFFGIILEEISQLKEAANLNYYFDDFSNLMDLTVIVVYFGSLCSRIIGFLNFDDDDGKGLWWAGISFDLLAIEAVLLIPRMFAFLTVFPYFGGLLPGLTKMCVEFFKFMLFVVVVYLGFLISFTMLGYKHGYYWEEISALLVHVFFGASSEGFKYDQGISPWLGPPLMLIFITLSNLLLVAVLVSLMNNELRRSLANANQTYVLTFSSIVVEIAINNTELSYFFPPFNIFNETIVRLFRLFLNESQHCILRIYTMKLTHWPLVFIIMVLDCITFQSSKIFKREKNSNIKAVSISKITNLNKWQKRRQSDDDFKFATYKNVSPVKLQGDDTLDLEIGGVNGRRHGNRPRATSDL